jgi:hypothetical protein
MRTHIVMLTPLIAFDCADPFDCESLEGSE